MESVVVAIDGQVDSVHRQRGSCYGRIASCLDDCLVVGSVEDGRAVGGLEFGRLALAMKGHYDGEEQVVVLVRSYL